MCLPRKMFDLLLLHFAIRDIVTQLRRPVELYGTEL